MKLISRILLINLLLMLAYLPARAQLQVESQQIIFNTADSNPYVIRPNQSFEQSLTFESRDYAVRRFIRVIGGIQMPGKFAPRGEEFFRQAEYLIDDNLDSSNAYKDKYSLYFNGENSPFEQHAYNRITGLQLENNNELNLEVAVRHNNLEVAPDGDFGIELQIYYKKENRHPDEIYDKPDSIIYIPILRPANYYVRRLSNNVLTYVEATDLIAETADKKKSTLLSLAELNTIIGKSLKTFPPFEWQSATAIGFTVENVYYELCTNTKTITHKLDLPKEIYNPLGNFKLLKESLHLPSNTASILMRIGGTKFSGECWVEAPKIYQDKKVIFNSQFTKNAQEQDDYNYWVGINLATRSCPKWRLDFNGKKIFDGRIFDRSSDIADFYIELPDSIDKTGTLKLTLEKEAHRAAFPYNLKRVELIEESKRDFELVAVPRYISVGDTTSILLETNRPNIRLDVKSEKPSIVILEKSKELAQTGLHTIRIVATSPDVNTLITISDGKETRTGIVKQIISKEKDNVYLSSGDDVYIDKEYAPYNQYFKWYFRERVGNWYHFRPSYQWSGVRITDENVISHYTDMLNQMNVPYAWQVEGRTLAATRINPSIKSLESPMFRGKQAHENDGGYYYWRHFLYKGLHSDMAARTRPYGGIFAKHPPIYTDKGIFIHYNPYGVTDMPDGANKLIANLSYSRGESTRHTGPSTIFRYLYQAGYDWLGAEQMYGPEDVIMSSLRGASRAYNKNNFGSLHAVQWGSHPFTDPKHSLRFYLSLAVAYTHGSSHINTEEALWTDEYANDRYTKSGKEHLYAQHQMLDYIETHSRKGLLNTKIAVIQGRNDAWKSFERSSLWSQKGEKWNFNKATESFDLLKVFYPENNINYCSTDGLFTSTPYGLIDILPIEASNEVMKQYKALIFLGWNTFDNADFIRIKKFVEQGGTVLLSAAHLNSESQPNLPVKFPEDDTVIKSLLGVDYEKHKEKVTIPIGEGYVIYYPQGMYPAEDVIRNSYIEDIKSIASKIVSNEYEKGWIKASPHINFSAWDSECFRTLYALNVDWKTNAESQTAKFVLGDKEFSIYVGKYSITTIRCKNNIAAMLKGNTSDILKIEEDSEKWVITCQITAPDTILVFNGQTGAQRVQNMVSVGINKIVMLK